MNTITPAVVILLVGILGWSMVVTIVAFTNFLRDK